MNKNTSNIIIPKKVQYIIETLKRNGFKSYVVGGCVRDSLLHKVPKDWDITTNAEPNTIIDIFNDLGHKTYEVGKAFGTIIVNIHKEDFEVTTFRCEKDYINNRKPSIVYFTKDIKEDLKRRDFTINAMAYNYEDGLIDIFHGKSDLNKALIKTVGNSSDRFFEDALRMLRAIRFSTCLNFTLDPLTKNGIYINRSLIRNISKERITTELTKIFSDKNCYKGILTLFETEIIYDIFQIKNYTLENDLKLLNRFSHIFYLDLSLEEKLSFFLFIIYKYILKASIESIRLKECLSYPNEVIKHINTNLKYLYNPINKATRLYVCKIINEFSLENLNDFLQVYSAYILILEDKVYEEILKDFLKEKEYIIQNRVPISLKDLNINGKGLIDLGIKEGIRIKKILNILLEKTIENPKLNSKEKLIEEAIKVANNI
ncbi:polynucleotide adenylyltransferase [Clostridiaceae bacterium 14S0207]|nr:polynucleotide adenylyltransferase [Clostridiaceae bacterium 14S0207]